MIDFMVIGLPRSGTTWLANWLTYTNSYCLHDPLNKMHYEEWDKPTATHFPPNSWKLKRGISCTGIWRWPEWVNAHPAKKIVIERPFDDVCQSLLNKDLMIELVGSRQLLASINAPRIQYEDIFNYDKASEIWKYLIGGSFHAQRYRQLCEMHVEPAFGKVCRNVNVASRLHRE